MIFDPYDCAPGESTWRRVGENGRLSVDKDNKIILSISQRRSVMKTLMEEKRNTVVIPASLKDRAKIKAVKEGKTLREWVASALETALKA
jgi:predicted HicB family RNase H-like nuclease